MESRHHRRGAASQYLNLALGELEVPSGTFNPEAGNCILETSNYIIHPF